MLGLWVMGTCGHLTGFYMLGFWAMGTCVYLTGF